ncbi:MAG: 16S rRNA (uracil(1498)-N(3))-methyltransferase [Spirochaetaceae bacterium]|nr:16S rRNA (uracil(1498)-N(3))-methyltransferase [Spirochaetaceae bacterium]
MKQFILNAAPDERGFARLTGGEFHYLARVRRMKTGDGFEALSPDGSRLHIEVKAVERDSIILQCASAAETAKILKDFPLPPPIHLFQALPRGAKLDLIVRQAVEIEAASVIPFYSERCQVKTDSFKNRALRLGKIIKEARQQSGSRADTVLEAPFSFNGAISRWEELKSSSESPAGFFLHEAFIQKTGFHDVLSVAPGLVAAVVGPEGGFTAKEAARLQAAGFTPVILGASILRVETAALYALSVIRALLLERDMWTASKK